MELKINIWGTYLTLLTSIAKLSRIKSFSVYTSMENIKKIQEKESAQMLKIGISRFKLFL